MKYTSTLLFLSLFIIVSCNKKQTARAKIFERKEIENDKLMIKYRFLVDGKTFSDSAIINNRVINTDSIAIKFESSDPSKTSLSLED